MSPEELGTIQEAIRGEGLDGWLFCNFRHRDKLSDDILGLSHDTTNSRLWFYAVPANGSPLKIIHAVEPQALDVLPGTGVFYIAREDLLAALKPLSGKRWGVHSSETILALSYLDAGTAAVLERAGLKLVSAAPLIQRFRGLLGAEAIASHERAAVHLYEIVGLAWDLVKEAHKNRKPIYEGDVRSLMLSEMEKRKLFPDHPPIVAAGPNAGNPHYDFENKGALFKEDDAVQFDLWAKEELPGAVFADISWIGVFAEKASSRIEKTFIDLIAARDRAFSFIEEKLASGQRPSGAMVDKAAREMLIGKGYEKAIKHRTGHGIDTEIHGSGANMDSVEFPDSRLLLDGACFSIEPGLYFEDFGLRTEIDVYIQSGKAFISGKPHSRQSDLLLC
ncbi:M24 family metallopeptidase [Leadbettera azotonutricia]|uniref:Peptidase M24 n=1 Tax=Leadbettera azotonutricia (strain ATCC BAA-888 / DSM 13862 / ZAS-9) TaxID=545695 RepID=F5YAD5_LEAAZ|nr:M24 family metallopeptidase [Leadbettera azotonutricia]AEF80962.1 peptidase M24 [Leadbettera azotonutricia ZAS-9]